MPEDLTQGQRNKFNYIEKNALREDGTLVVNIKGKKAAIYTDPEKMFIEQTFAFPYDRQ